MRAQLSNRAVVAIGAAGLVLLVVALWFLVVSPKRKQATDLESEVAAARTQLTQRKAELANPSAAVTLRTSDVFRLAKALPEDANVAAVVLDIDRLASARGLALEGILPTAVVPVTGYYAQPLTVTVQGRFGDVSGFLGDLRELVTVKNRKLFVRGRLYSVTEVKLGKPEGTAAFPAVRAAILLHAFGLMANVPAIPTTPESTSPPTNTTAAGATP